MYLDQHYDPCNLFQASLLISMIQNHFLPLCIEEMKTSSCLEKTDIKIAFPFDLLPFQISC